MKTQLRKALLTRFAHALNHRFTPFTDFDTDQKFWIWVWPVAPELHFFVALQPMEKRDQFTVEVAWARRSEFPWGANARTDPTLAEGRERLGLLASGADEQWDVTPEKRLREGRGDRVAPDPPLRELLARVPSRVDDALDKLATHGLPFLRRAAVARGVA